MSQTVRQLAQGPGWKAIEVVCTSGAGDRPYEEEHADHCVALVAGGTFTYRSDQGRAMMTPGALLLGNRGACFECGHEYGRGDRCISFHFSEKRWQGLIEELHGGQGASFVAPKLPPRQDLAPLYADAESASAQGDEHALEETGLRLAAAALLGGDRNALPKITSRDQKRVVDAIRAFERGEIAGLPPAGWDNVIIATGPLTSPALSEAIRALTAERNLAP